MYVHSKDNQLPTPVPPEYNIIPYRYVYHLQLTNTHVIATISQPELLRGCRTPT